MPPQIYCEQLLASETTSVKPEIGTKKMKLDEIIKRLKDYERITQYPFNIITY